MRKKKQTNKQRNKKTKQQQKQQQQQKKQKQKQKNLGIIIFIIIINITCNKVAKAVKQCSIHFLSVELRIRRYNEQTKFSIKYCLMSA